MTENIRIQTEQRYAPAPETSDEIDLRELLATLIDAKWLIGAITAVVLFFALLYAVFATPIYQSNVLLQVNEENAAFQTGAMSDLAEALGGQAPPADTEIAIMRSRFVVGQAVDKLGLTIEATPNYLPLIGGFMARHYDGLKPASPFLWLDSYAWGGESIDVTRLNVQDPWLDEELTLVAGKGQTYTLYGPEGKKLLTGEVGQPAFYPSPSGRGQGEGSKISLFVSSLVARPGTEFTLTKHPRLEVINNLTQNISASETGKGTNIVSMSLEGQDRQQVVRILDTLAATYIQQNVENNAQQARESLKFLKTQLPKIKTKLDAAQSALAQYQTKHQALDISADTKGLLDQMVNVQQQLSELKLKETEMSGRFNAGFPGLQAVRAQIAKMNQIKAQLEDRIKDVPKAQQEIFQLKRDVEVDGALYMALLNQAQQLKITEAGTVGNARIIDHAAMPIKPVKPKKSLIAALGLVLGTMLGVFLAFLRQAFNHGVDDPDQVEQQFGLPVYATVPHSDDLEKLERAAKRAGESHPILARVSPDALAIEALRSLRTSMQFALMDARNHIVAISGPSPGIGKSFVAVNLARLMGDTSQRVLLIDGDMRRGHLHDYFGLARQPGLSDVLVGKLGFEQAVHRGEDNLDTLFSGTIPPNPSELLMTPRFAQLAKEVSAAYDLVIIDAPPMLAVTDGAIIAKQAAVNFMVLRAGQHAEREIKLMLRRLEQNGTAAQGIIFNDITRKASSYSKSKYGYQYQYEYK